MFKSNLHSQKRTSLAFVLTMLMTLVLGVNQVYSQAEVTAWGNVTGIRKQGQLFEFESSIRVISADGKKVAATALEKQRPKFKRDSDKQIITTNIDDLFFDETVQDLTPGNIQVSLQLNAHKDTAITGAYFCITLPSKDYADGHLRFTGLTDKSLKGTLPTSRNFIDVSATGVEFIAAHRQLKVAFDGASTVMVKHDTTQGKNDVQLYVALKLNGVHKGDVVNKVFTITASGDIDKAPIVLALNTAQQGRAFDGLGGNFRLQNPKTDPQVIDYCLKNLRVAWGRVELPWRFWQPDKDVDPTIAANAGKLAPQVVNAIAMAHKLDSLGIPIILSAWFPPAWAITGKPNFRHTNGIWGNPLNHDNDAAIYKSITDYIVFLKSKYGIEVKLFSFNESDLGINIRLTGEEHDNFIKGLGAYMAAQGLKTKPLLGDNSDATTYKFIYPAMDDPSAQQYIGAVSFHSWRGWDTPLLEKWADAATKLNKPLLVGEGSIDAAASAYPAIFQEQTYAIQEINLYVRILAICQPAAILQWQLTADYSPLIGGGIFGNNEPLHPGQRFWNLKQLANTPKGLFAMPITCDRPNVTCAALGDNDKGAYTIHLVNNGATRAVTLTGLPAKVKLLHIYSTSKQANMVEGEPVSVKDGMAKFKLPTTSFTTLISE